MSAESVLLLAVTVNALVCAAVPIETKAKAPALWKVLDALAFNVGHAVNRLDSQAGWQKVLAAMLAGAVATVVAVPHPQQPAQPQPEAKTPAAVLPADPTPCAAPAAVTPAADASSSVDAGGSDA